MTTALSLSPLFGSTVGFDRFESLFDKLTRGALNSEDLPPYDIERTGEDRYEITLSVAGFSDTEIGLNVQENQLIVSGTKQDCEAAKKTYLYKGISSGSFKQVFQLAPYVTVVDAVLKEGLLHIQLNSEVPEAKKPRRIEIRSKPEPRAIAAPDAHAA